jgi:serine/threonine-protein phosphatase 6 regulatory ankyrin repeat subunit B
MRRLKRINHNLIMWARAGDAEEVEDCLVEASINFKDTHGWTALMWATYRNNVPMVELLVTKGASSSPKNKEGWPAMCMAATLGYFDCCQALMRDKHCNLNIRGNAGMTPLMLTAGLGNMEMTQLLLSKGARVDDQSFQGWTALMRAAAKNHLPIVIFLLFHRAKLNTKDTQGWTALDHARRKNQQPVIDLFMDWPGLDQILFVGMTPLDWARENVKKEVVDVLEDWKELATHKCTTNMRKVTTGSQVMDLDCIWKDDLAGADACDQCERHGLLRGWHGADLGIYLCENCLEKPDAVK